LSVKPPISARFDDAIDARTGTDEPFRLGIFGGTFDPVHIGHMNIAERALEQFGLDGVLFIPTGRPVRKALLRVSSTEDRCTMLEKALADNDRFDLSRIEVDREGATYTIDTLHALKERYGDKARFFFIVGADSAVDLPTWYKADEIAQLTEVLSAPRTIPETGSAAMVHTVTNGFVVHEIQAPSIDVASSELRAWAQQGRSLRYLVPDAVLDHIVRQGLYRR
jgi:nicotinate-nucleotide adenylyltransferase